MLRFFYSPKYKYTNRSIIDLGLDAYYKDIDYENIDSPDTINGHIIYALEENETVPTYVLDLETNKRWFVTGLTQLRTGKFQISMIRDIISESSSWRSERAYINAGTATDYCKYKTWGLPFTNTKVNQERLNINGKSSFFVFYANEQTGSGTTITEKDLELSYTSSATVTSYDVTYESLQDIPGFEYVDIGQFVYLKDKAIYLRGSNGVLYNDEELDVGGEYYLYTNTHVKLTQYPDGERYDFGYDSNDKKSLFAEGNILKLSLPNPSASRSWITEPYANALKEARVQYHNSLNKSNYDSIEYSDVNELVLRELDKVVEKVIRIPDSVNPALSHFYKIHRSINERTFSKNIPVNNNVSSYMKNYFSSVNISAISTSRAFMSYEGTDIYNEYTLEDIGSGTVFEFNFKADQSKLPKSNVRCVNIVSDDEISDALIARSLMICQTNAEAQGDNIGRVIDIQYLPFSIATTKNENFKFGDHNATAEFLTNDDFSYDTDLDDLTDINKETDSIVIVSPSRKSQFKFKPYNNDGNMEFSTSITIKPFQSVIYVRPSTKGLLMRDWNDKECLIIQEDFSLTKTDSAWANYVYNNRNYQNAFNLQLQTKEFERTWERRIEQAQAQSDEWTARNITSQKYQTYSANLPIISGISGAIGTAFKDTAYMEAAQLDREYNEAMYQKSMEVARDTFKYQVDNIKSQPLIPNTITAIDVKMLDGVYLEYYSTNDTEKASIENYYIYNGNRIDNYGTFQDYWGGFVRGKIIISENYTQPELDELNRRLELGVFTGGIL